MQGRVSLVLLKKRRNGMHDCIKQCYENTLWIYVHIYYHTEVYDSTWNLSRTKRYRNEFKYLFEAFYINELKYLAQAFYNMLGRV